MEISFDDFLAIEMRAGTVVKACKFEEAKISAHKVWVDFGADIGVLKTSARITDLYEPEDLIGKQVMGVVNFPVKQIGPIRSEFLLTGFIDDGKVVLAVPDRDVKNGARLA